MQQLACEVVEAGDGSAAHEVERPELVHACQGRHLLQLLAALQTELPQIGQPCISMTTLSRSCTSVSQAGKAPAACCMLAKAAMQFPGETGLTVYGVERLAAQLSNILHAS